MMRLQRKSTIETADRELMVAEARVHSCAIVVSGREIRIQLERPVEANECIRCTIRSAQDNSKINVSPWVIRCEARCLTIIRYSVLLTSEPCERRSSQAVRA